MTPKTTSRAHWFLVITFVAIIALVPLGQAVVEISRGQWPGLFRVATRPPTATNLKEFEATLEDASVVNAAVRPRLQTVQYQALQDLGAQVMAGRNGWLFYQPGVIASSERAKSGQSTPAQALAAVCDLRDQLATRHIRLVVMPVPNKESVHPEALTGRKFDGHPLSPDTREFLAGCAKAGVPVIDLFAAFAEHRRANDAALYLKQDTHWTPLGAELAARTLSARLRALDGITPGNVRFGREVLTSERQGDLVEMLRAPGITAGFAPEHITATRILDPEHGEPYRDARTAQVVVLGDSFLRIYQRDEPGSAGFVAHLAAELGQPVVSIINDGGASTLVRQALARRAQLLEHARVVVWEFVERDLRLGFDGWKLVPVLPSTAVAP